MRPRRPWLAVAACLLSAIPLRAQQTPPPPPRLLQIDREEVKIGRAAAHEAFEVQWPAAFRRAKSTNYYLAVTSVTGAPEAWYIAPADNYAALEAFDKEIDKTPGLRAELQRLSAGDAEMLTGWRQMIAEYRPELSLPGTPVNIGTMRGFSITTTRLRPGHGADWKEMRTILRDVYTKAGIDSHNALYQVVRGVNTPTYIGLNPFRSLAEMDARAAMGPKIDSAWTAEQRARYDKLTADAVITVETETFMFSPKMSYVGEQTIAADPEFWTSKAVVAQRPSLAKPAANVKEPQKP
jgi:hypothetical protein